MANARAEARKAITVLGSPAIRALELKADREQSLLAMIQAHQEACSAGDQELASGLAEDIHCGLCGQSFEDQSYDQILHRLKSLYTEAQTQPELFEQRPALGVDADVITHSAATSTGEKGK